MIPYLTKRILLALFTLFIIMLMSYSLVRLAPGDPTQSTMLGDNPQAAQGLSSEKNQLAVNQSLRDKLHLDEPVYIGFFYWFKGVLTKGDFGSSASVDKGRPVVDLIMERLPVTVKLNFWAILITFMLSIPIGIYSAVYPEAKSDKIITFLLFFLYSLPPFWVALLLQATICQGGFVSIFPLKGLSSVSFSGHSTWQILWDSAYHYILPVYCLCYSGFAGLSRYARSGMADILNQDYIRTARAKGVPEFMVLFKHVLRNGIIPLITLIAGLLPGLVGGSIIVEYVFNIPGMGSLSMLALTSRDIPLMMALFGFVGALTLAGILISDIFYVIADPRINFEGRR